MVSGWSMVFMVVTILVCVLAPIGSALFISTRRHPDGTKRFPRIWRAFGCGALAFVISQVLTRMPLMMFVVPQLPESVSGFLMSAPVGSFSAGLFEETGRLVVMLLLMKAFRRWIDGVSFGLGHGGIEAILLVAMANVNNLVLASLINAGQWDTIAQALPPEAAEQLHTALTETVPALFLLGGVERLAAITLHIACSLIVLAGIAHGRKLIAWIAAVLLHGTFNLVAVSLVSAGIDLVLVEVVLLALAIALWFAMVRARPLYPAAIASEMAPAPRVG